MKHIVDLTIVVENFSIDVTTWLEVCCEFSISILLITLTEFMVLWYFMIFSHYLYDILGKCFKFIFFMIQRQNETSGSSQ